MIIEWLVGVAMGIATWFTGLFATDWEVPTFLSGLDNTLNSVFANISGVSVWADWGFIIAVVLVVVSTWAVGLSVKVVRAIASHIPFFGGSG